MRFSFLEREAQGFEKKTEKSRRRIFPHFFFEKKTQPQQLLEDVCSFLATHCHLPYVEPSTTLSELAVASARRRSAVAEEKRRNRFSLFSSFGGGGGRGKKKKKGAAGAAGEAGEATAVEAKSSSTASSSDPSPSPLEVEAALVDLFLSLEERFDLRFGDEGSAALATTVADASELLSREIAAVNDAVSHIEVT